MKKILSIMLLTTMFAFYSCDKGKESSESKEDTKSEELSGKINVDSKGLEIKTCYYAIDKPDNRTEEAKVPFGSRMVFVFDDISGLKEVNGLYNIGFKISIYEGDKLLRHSEDVFANDPGIEPSKLTYLYAYIDAFYPIREGVTFTFKSEIWDKNSDNKAIITGDFQLDGKVPGELHVVSEEMTYASVILKNGKQVAMDNVYHPGDTVSIYIEGVSGFNTTEEGYSFTGTYTITDMKGNIISPEESEEINIPRMDRLFTSVPVNKVKEPTDIYWIVGFKDNNGDAKISVKAKLHLEP